MDGPVRELPNYSEGVFKKDVQMIAEKPPSLEERFDSFIHAPEFPIIALIVIGLAYLKMR